MAILFKPKQDPRWQHLRSLVLFQNLSNREMVRIQDHLHHRTFFKGEVIFDEGEEGQGLFIITSGQVEIVGQNRFFSSNKILFKTGDFFGEMALLDNSPRLAQARATESTELICLFRAEFFNLMETDGKIAAKVSMQLARHLSRRLREVVVSKNTLFNI